METSKERINKLLGFTRDEVVTVDDIKELISFFAGLVNDLKKENEKSIDDFVNGKRFQGTIDRVNNEVEEALISVKTDIKDLENRIKSDLQSASKLQGNGIKDIMSQWASEIADIKDSMPESVDSSAIESKITAIESKLSGMREVSPEETRDKLENLKGDERLDKSAIKGLEELEAKITNNSVRMVGGIAGIQMYVGGVKKGTVKNVNFVAGSNMTVAHSVVNGQDTITFTSSGGGSSNIYSEVLEEVDLIQVGDDVTYNANNLANHGLALVLSISRNGADMIEGNPANGYSVSGTGDSAVFTFYNAITTQKFKIVYTYA